MSNKNSIIINFEKLNKKIINIFKEKKKRFIFNLESLIKDVINNVIEN